MRLKNKISKLIDVIKDTDINEIEISSFWGAQKIKLRKSIIAECNIPINTTIDIKMISIKRPGYGLPPAMFYEVIGKKVNRNISKYDPLNWDDLIH